MELLRETERFALQRTEVSVQRVESSDGKAEKQKYGVIEDNKKPSDSIRPAIWYVCIHFIILIPKKSLKKNNTNSFSLSVFVLFLLAER